MYHYVRNPEETPYKGIHAVRENEFIAQVNYLKHHFELATLDSIDAFLKGDYSPSKDMMVLTFDDGLKEHGDFVTEVLSKNNIQGQFFIPTACITEGYVLPVHKNHFLLASLDFTYYKNTFLTKLKEKYPTIDLQIDLEKVKNTYRWDTEEVAAFKYLLNYKLPRPIRNEILKIVFEQELGKEEAFAKTLYLSWEEMQSMQNAGMAFGAHSHTHNVLSSLTAEEQVHEIDTSVSLIKKHLTPQEKYPFSYPFGKPNTFNDHTINCLKNNEIAYAYSTVVGDSDKDVDRFSIKRIDPKDIQL